MLRYNKQTAAPLYAELADVMGIIGSGCDDHGTRAEAFVDHIQRRMTDSEAPRLLHDQDVTEDSLALLAADAIKQQRLLINNPVGVTEQDVLVLYREAY